MPVQSANNDTDSTVLVEPVLVTSSLAFLARLEVDVALRSSAGQYDEEYEHCVTVWLDAGCMSNHPATAAKNNASEPGMPQLSFT